MANVYSTRFLASTDPSSPPTYTVPAGFVAVVRSIDQWCPAIGSGYYSLVQIVSPYCVLRQAFFSAEGGSDSWYGRQVVEPGEQLTINSNVPSPGSVIVSGYLLTLP